MSYFHARKRFGQHFLIDHGILQKIVHAISPQREEHLLEIGPGKGALTNYLHPLVKQLDLVEIDRDLAQELKKHFSNQANVRVHQADALAFNIAELTSTPHELRIVGNLPYNISTPLLFKLFSELSAIKDMHFMVQKEVGERLTAKTSSSHYSRLSVMAQYYCDNQLLFTVGPQVFQPRPKVDSAVIRLQPHLSPICQAKDLTLLNQVVKEAFTYRRKTVSNALSRLIHTDLFMHLNIDPKKRPQDLSVAEYVRISNAIAVQ